MTVALCFCESAVVDYTRTGFVSLVCSSWCGRFRVKVGDVWR